MYKFLIIPAAVLYFFLSGSAFASEEFITDISVYYHIQNDASTVVTHNIILENALTDIYATNYAFNLTGIKPVNVESFEGSKKLATVVSQQGENATITIAFEDALVGKGERRQFSIRYKDSSVITKTGEVWEMIIPKLSNSQAFRDYRVTLEIPKSLGELAYISPQASLKESQKDKDTFSFSKDQLLQTPVTAAFGKFQVFNYELLYHLENPLTKSAYTEIALPPDTSYQRIFLEKLEPAPHEVNVDQDGNWIAKYIMAPREKVDVKAVGSVQIFAEPIQLLTSSKTLEDSLKSSPVWQIENQKIIELARSLKTPENIYNFVVQTLKYDYDRVKPNITRYGAFEALNNPKNAICMEFTDLFIALSRAAGIPAREINGYAYTEDAKLQPLSLVADVLHSWAEYWDEDRKMWIQVDPTWGSTTGGADFFNKLDLRHFAFVIHGKDPYEPYPPGSYKLGPNPQKDVFVSFGKLFSNRDPKLTTDLNFKRQNIFSKNQANLLFKNSGKVTMKPLNVSVYFDDKIALSHTVRSLVPFEKEVILLDFPATFFGINMPETIKVLTETENLSFPTNKRQIMMAHSAISLVVISGLLFIVLAKIYGVSSIQLRNKFATLYGLLSNYKRITQKPS